ncbi:MAG: hypothetical protein RJB10_1368 [Pseudomonadota bacterium]
MKKTSLFLATSALYFAASSASRLKNWKPNSKKKATPCGASKKMVAAMKFMLWMKKASVASFIFTQSH